MRDWPAPWSRSPDSLPHLALARVSASDGRLGALAGTNDHGCEMTVLPLVAASVSWGCSTPWSTASASAAAYWWCVASLGREVGTVGHGEPSHDRSRHAGLDRHWDAVRDASSFRWAASAPPTDPGRRRGVACTPACCAAGGLLAAPGGPCWPRSEALVWGCPALTDRADDSVRLPS
jgi:hypothetical protein